MRLILSCCAANLLSGCLGTGTLHSWEGRPVNDLIYSWGPPTQDTELPDGRRVLSYNHHRDHAGTTMYCDALFRANPQGLVEVAEVSGNMGGCNRLLLSKPAAQ